MISGQTLSKRKDSARPDPCPVPALTTRRVMTAPARVPRNLLNEAAPAVDSVFVRFSHIGDRPYSKHRLVRTSDGVRLAVRHTGPRTAEHTVVFLHGLCPNHPRGNVKSLTCCADTADPYGSSATTIAATAGPQRRLSTATELTNSPMTSPRYSLPSTSLGRLPSSGTRWVR